MPQAPLTRRFLLQIFTIVRYLAKTIGSLLRRKIFYVITKKSDLYKVVQRRKVIKERERHGKKQIKSPWEREILNKRFYIKFY